MITRDRELSKLVNIITKDGAPRTDIYQIVADRLNTILKDEVVLLGSTDKAPKPMRFKLNRSVSKILTMLIPYNVSLTGFADRLLEEMTGIQGYTIKRGGVSLKVTLVDFKDYNLSKEDAHKF
jgi:hypothetical protein